MKYDNQTALITGAASGMGLEMSRTFAAQGGNVLMCDVNREKVESAAADIVSAGGRAEACVCDVRDYQQVVLAREKAVERFGSIDLLCNFAGGTAVRMLNVDPALEFPDIPISVYDWGLDVNLRAQLYFDHAVMKQMRAQKSGLIVNIGSCTGLEGDPRGVEYSTAKSGAMIGLTRSVAQYGAPYGVRCVCVSPGPVLTRPAMANMKTLLGRAAEPAEVIKLILYLFGEDGQFINGENIMIDGGRVAMGRQ